MDCVLMQVFCGKHGGGGMAKASRLGTQDPRDASESKRYFCL